MHEYKLLNVILSLFDGGAAAGAGDGAGAAAPAQGEVGTSGDTQALPAVAGRGKRTGDTQKVLYGKQTDPAVAVGQAAADEGTPPVAGEGKQDGEPGTVTSSDTLDAKRKAYRDLMEGEYKDIHTAEIQRIIDTRFRETKTLEQQVARNKPVLDLLMQRYGIADGDPAKLMAAVENDNAYWSEAAEEAGEPLDEKPVTLAIHEVAEGRLEAGGVDLTAEEEGE